MDYYSITLKCKGKNGKLYCKHTLIESEDNKVVFSEYDYPHRIYYDNINNIKNKNNEKFNNLHKKSNYDVFGNFTKK